MKVALLSDIHGNLPALELAIRNLKGVDAYLVLGDVVNYGPWSNECVELLDDLTNCVKLKGNHEGYFLQGECSSQNHLSNLFFDICFQTFNKSELIQEYIDSYYLDKFKCVHTIDDNYVFEDSDIEIDRSYIIGHSHKQYKVEKNNYLIINPGSVGQNRQYINEINFAVFEPNKCNVEFKSIIYNVDIVISEMKKQNYPKECLDYYQLKDRR